MGKPSGIDSDKGLHLTEILPELKLNKCNNDSKNLDCTLSKCVKPLSSQVEHTPKMLALLPPSNPRRPSWRDQKHKRRLNKLPALSEENLGETRAQSGQELKTGGTVDISELYSRSLDSHTSMAFWRNSKQKDFSTKRQQNYKRSVLHLPPLRFDGSFP